MRATGVTYQELRDALLSAISQRTEDYRCECALAFRTPVWPAPSEDLEPDLKTRGFGAAGTLPRRTGPVSLRQGEGGLRSFHPRPSERERIGLEASFARITVGLEAKRRSEGKPTTLLRAYGSARKSRASAEGGRGGRRTRRRPGPGLRRAAWPRGLDTPRATARGSGPLSAAGPRLSK